MKTGLVMIAMVALAGACGSDTAGGDGVDGGANADTCAPPDGVQRPSGWGEASHCKGAEPDYARLFDDTVVHRIDIRMTADTHQSMLDDLSAKLAGGGGPGGPGGPGGGGTEDPIWVPVTVEYDGVIWNYVGMRYKGNSSLRSAWQQGVRKLSFRFNFDKFEDEHPEVDDQRFYGFKKMTFSNGFKDRSLIRDKVAADIFRGGGVPAARGSFARVYVDYGDGPVYFGLYTMIEDPSNKMLDTQFDDDGGNLYKPDGTGATWGSFDQGSFEKDSNEDAADWSDIIAAIDALHASRTDAAAWRAGLDAVFDTGAFLRCLAINQTIVNWDSYGFMTHNYYVYGDPTKGGRLVWFPWDLNEALLTSGGGRGGDPTSVMLDGVTSEWPLIRFLLDDPVYHQVYVDELQAALDGTFAAAPVKAKMEAYHALISPYVVGAEGEAAPYTFLSSDADFETSLTSGQDPLLQHVDARRLAVQNALAQ